jgi:hypothetical protein
MVCEKVKYTKIFELRSLAAVIVGPQMSPTLPALSADVTTENGTDK